MRFVNYNQRKWSESASVRPNKDRDVAPLFASKESGFYFDVWKSAFHVTCVTVWTLFSVNNLGNSLFERTYIL